MFIEITNDKTKEKEIINIYKIVRICKSNGWKGDIDCCTLIMSSNVGGLDINLDVHNDNRLVISESYDNIRNKIRLIKEDEKSFSRFELMDI